MKYYRQYDEKGNHRLGTTKYKRGEPEGPIRWGEWAPYTAPAMLGQYAAVTDYYTGSAEFPDSKVLYRIQRDVWPLSELTERGERNGPVSIHAK